MPSGDREAGPAAVDLVGGVRLGAVGHTLGSSFGAAPPPRNHLRPNTKRERTRTGTVRFDITVEACEAGSCHGSSGPEGMMPIIGWSLLLVVLVLLTVPCCDSASAVAC